MRFRNKVIALLAVITLMFPSMATAANASTRVDELMGDMTLRQKATQLLMPDFRHWAQEGQSQVDFDVMNDEVAEILVEYDFGGVILFAQNVKETEQTARLTDALQKAALDDNEGAGHSIPLLITIDQEGGIVTRLGTGTALPGNMALGATGSKDHARSAGQIIGRELSALGINVNLAPVLDVNNNPRNPVIGLRSYSSNPELVAELGVETIKGLAEYGVAGAAKHFPGHGDTGVDSHYGLPSVDKSLEALKSMELIPFQAAMDEGIDMIMTAHMMFPQLDDEYPATLSHKILTGLIRDEMNYEGIVITDAMNMAAITDNFGEVESTVLAIEAGVDIVLMPTILRSKADIETKLDPIIDAIVERAETDEAFMARVDESVRRVLEMKERRGLLDYEANDKPIEEKVAFALEAVGSDENRDLERQITRDAVTVVKNDNHVLPFNAEAGDKVVMFAAYTSRTRGLEFGIKRLQAEGHLPEDLNVETHLLVSGTTPISTEEINALIEDADYVIAVSETGSVAGLRPTAWQTLAPERIVDAANELGIDNVVMSISQPYDGARYPNANALIQVYGSRGMDPTEGLRPETQYGPNIPAGIEIIFGQANANGKLPIDLVVLNENGEVTDEIAYPLGHGLTLNEPASQMNLEAPETVEVEETFNVTLDVEAIEGITNNPYGILVTLNDGFEYVGDTYEVDGNAIIIEKDADDIDQIVLEITTTIPGEGLNVVASVQLVDSRNRVYDYEEAALLSILTDVVEVDVDPVDPVDPDPTDPTDPVDPVDPVDPTDPEGELPSTGHSMMPVITSAAALIIAGVFFVLYSRRKTQLDK